MDIEGKCSIQYAVGDSALKIRQLSTGPCNFEVPPFISVLGGDKFSVAWANAAGADKKAELAFAVFDSAGKELSSSSEIATLPASVKGVDLGQIDSKHLAATWSSLQGGKQVVSMALIEDGKQVGSIWSLSSALNQLYPKIVPMFDNKGQATSRSVFLTNELKTGNQQGATTLRWWGRVR